MVPISKLVGMTQHYNAFRNDTMPNECRYNTLLPSSCEMASAMAVLPVPGGPANNKARPAIFFDLIRSNTIPAACNSFKYKHHIQ